MRPRCVMRSSATAALGRVTLAALGWTMLAALAWVMMAVLALVAALAALACRRKF